MNERQNYSIIHFDMFDKGTVVCVSFASASHSTKKSKETSTLRSQRHMQVLNKNTYPPTIMAICGRNQSDDLVSSSLEAAVDSWVRQLGGFPEKLIFGNWVGCWFVGGDLIENMCVLFSNLLKYLVLFVEIDFALIIFWIYINGARSCLWLSRIITNHHEIPVQWREHTSFNIIIPYPKSCSNTKINRTLINLHLILPQAVPLETTPTSAPLNPLHASSGPRNPRWKGWMSSPMICNKKTSRSNN